MLPSAAPERVTVIGWIILFAIVAGTIWGLTTSVHLRWVIGIFVLLIALMAIFDDYRLKRIKEERKEESICSFSRELPAKIHDTWVVRAVYEELSQHLDAPLRPSDDLKSFWRIDPDELNDIAIGIASRAGRSMEDTKNNPMLDRVVTIADLILFIENQPRLPNKSP